MKFALIALTIAAVVGWWLSGYDPKVTGHDKNADFARRLLRCGITILLVMLGLSVRIFWIAVTIPLAIIWAGCASEFFAHGFHKLVDSADDRPFDPAQVARDLDELAALVKKGQGEQAIALCKKMREDGDASAMAIEAQLFQLYSDVLAGGFVPISPPLVEANALCVQGRFADAETKLNLLLKREPGNSIAGLMLVRIYGRDLKARPKAEAALQQVVQQPQVSVTFIKHARELILEWNGAVAPKVKSEHGIESLLLDPKYSPPPAPVPGQNPASVDELLVAGQLSTAIELLDRGVREQPGDFNGWLKLAEAHGFYCRDLTRAGKIVAKMEASSKFDPEQMKLAKAKLREWAELK